MLPEQLAPLSLVAMTLRGVGPYFYGSRLEIKPLTILCGANGSGKSTWLNVLQLLRKSLGRDFLPHRFYQDLADGYEYLEIMNACYFCAHPEQRQLLSDLSDDELGPPGTIGVEIVANRDFRLGDESRVTKQCYTIEQEFLLHGIVKSGSRFTIRMAHPVDGFTSPGDSIPGHFDLVELRFNDSSIVKREEYTNGEGMRLICSPSFITGVTWKTDAPVEIANTEYTAESRWSSIHPDISDSRAECIRSLLMERIPQLIKVMLDGCFHIGAIRRIDESIDENDESTPVKDADVSSRRYVGFEGEFAWPIERQFAANKMCHPARMDTSNDSPQELQYSLQNYVSTWMNDLTHTEIVPRDSRNVWSPDEHVSASLDSGDDPLRNLTGLILDSASPPHAVYPLESYDTSFPRACLSHPCFGRGFLGQVQPPSRFSAGFHQLFPIIVQLGVMRSGELFCLENPEVHLHPSLQIQLTEALIAHLASGRRMIIETHSDLVVRRVLRAILSEEVGQSDVQIYFTQIEPLDERLTKALKTIYYSSVIYPIRIDDQGRVENWPEGFMDDDLRESQRLLDIMYGRPSSVDEEE